MQRDFYSYDAKYLDDQGARFEIPARLPKKVVKEIQQTALRAYLAPDLIVATARYWGRFAGYGLAEPLEVIRQSG